MTPHDPHSAPPICVDLDGTLIRTDLLHETALAAARARPLSVLRWPLLIMQGKARLKRAIAETAEIDVTTLPYNEELLAWLRAERGNGRRIVLCTASDARLAHAVADHLGCFDEVVASDGEVNVSGRRKAEQLVARYGERGFDYAGNDGVDLHVWPRARQGILVDLPARHRPAAARATEVALELRSPAPTVKTWVKALRIHQWLKNVLIFAPLLGAHRLTDPALLAQGLLAFLAFSLCASSVYLTNDLFDLASDRQHPRKRNRPFASGRLPVWVGVAIAPILVVLAFGLAWTVSWPFVQWLGVYLAVTVAYSFGLKRLVLVDSITLAALYTLRIIAGGAAVGLEVSFWLMAFSMFLFLSLAFVKRYDELLVMREHGHGKAHGRDYRTEDAPLISALGIAAGYAAALVMALYITSANVIVLYTHPGWLWLTLPILIFWISWMWLQAHRHAIHDDPVMFAVRDATSLVAGALFLLVMWLAI